MTNRANEYLKERPALGALVVFETMAASGALWMVFLTPTGPVDLLTSRGFWFTMVLVGVPTVPTYYLLARD